MESQLILLYQLLQESLRIEEFEEIEERHDFYDFSKLPEEPVMDISRELKLLGLNNKGE